MMHQWAQSLKATLEKQLRNQFAAIQSYTAAYWAILQSNT